MTNSKAPALLITSADRTVPITVQQRSRLAPGDSMALICPIDLTRVFHRVAPFPAVVRVDDQTEAWDHPGPSRRPQFSDGSSVDEQMTEYTAGSSFAYQLTNFTNALSKLAVGIRGEWTFTPDGTGSLVRWSYEFKPLPGRGWIIAGPFKPLWRRYMTAALARCIQASEEDFDSGVSREACR
ncbi:SRPBCC family protein [Mycolicibacterium litorale]|uniref:SRPBCC family protein n=1 Tax=Mycolicibacterium litorale TaxID=758802 RepID=UPI003CEC0C5C